MKNTIFIDGEEYTENDIRELLNKHEHNCRLIEQFKIDMGKTTAPETNFESSAEGVAIE